VRALGKNVDLCNTALAKDLQCKHASWLANVSTEQLASLVGRLRSAGKQPTRDPNRPVIRAPGRSPR
jgi:hypothetical protein